MKLLVCIFISLLTSSASFAESIVITTWNIEHLGTSGRGFGGGYGAGKLEKRSDAQLIQIADFIKQELNSDVIALQEIAITHQINGESKSKQLDIIAGRLGESWHYYLPPLSPVHDSHSMYVGFLWNSQRLAIKTAAPMPFENQVAAGKALFDRLPVMAAYDIVLEDTIKNDFALVNVHLASGQHNDENHLIAMTMIEWELSRFLTHLDITESDRIILGDFNDNPYKTTSTGKQKYSPALYEHMQFKGYNDLVDPQWGSTRMDENQTSLIDHLLVNKSAQRHLTKQQAQIWKPKQEEYAVWRQTYSDHFPVSIMLDISNDDDAD